MREGDNYADGVAIVMSKSALSPLCCTVGSGEEKSVPMF